MRRSVFETFDLPTDAGRKPGDDGYVAPIPILRCPNRPVCTLLTAGFFASLWLIGGPLAPLVAVFVYGFFVAPRWDAFGLGIGLPILLMTAYAAYFVLGTAGTPLLAHFLMLTLMVFPCVAPIGVRGPQLKFPQSIGRTGFILFAMPNFVMLATQVWPAFDHAARVFWSLIWFPTDRIEPLVVLVSAGFLLPLVQARLVDIGAKGWLYFGWIALYFACAGGIVVEALAPHALMLSVILSVSLLVLCLWPSRDQPGQTQS